MQLGVIAFLAFFLGSAGLCRRLVGRMGWTGAIVGLIAAWGAALPWYATTLPRNDIHWDDRWQHGAAQGALILTVCAVAALIGDACAQAVRKRWFQNRQDLATGAELTLTLVYAIIVGVFGTILVLAALNSGS